MWVRHPRHHRWTIVRKQQSSKGVYTCDAIDTCCCRDAKELQSARNTGEYRAMVGIMRTSPLKR